MKEQNITIAENLDIVLEFQPTHQNVRTEQSNRWRYY
tara:strand:+ start:1234 stop:1344 length:111 start_codon:yes stop_codon:yes gene_type:complete